MLLSEIIYLGESYTYLVIIIFYTIFFFFFKSELHDISHTYINNFAITSRRDGGRGIEIDPREPIGGVVD